MMLILVKGKTSDEKQRSSGSVTAGTGVNFFDVNLCKDYRDKTEVPDPLPVEDLISYKLNNKVKLARLIAQYRDIFSNISEGTAFLLQGVTMTISSLG